MSGIIPLTGHLTKLEARNIHTTPCHNNIIICINSLTAKLSHKIIVHVNSWITKLPVTVILYILTNYNMILTWWKRCVKLISWSPITKLSWLTKWDHGSVLELLWWQRGKFQLLEHTVLLSYYSHYLFSPLSTTLTNLSSVNLILKITLLLRSNLVPQEKKMTWTPFYVLITASKHLIVSQHMLMLFPLLYK